MKKLIPLFLLGALSLSLSAEQLYIRNRPFKGAVQVNGKALWVELKSFAQAIEANISQSEGGGYRLSRTPLSEELPPVAAGKVAIGELLLDSQDIKGTTMISLDESAKPLGLRVSRNPQLGSIDVNVLPPESTNPTATNTTGAPVPMATNGPMPPIKVNQAGAAINLQSSLVAGRINIVDFYADWCGPCRQMAPVLEGFVAKNPRYCLLKVDIKDWKSPVALQYGLRSIPHIKIFDERGRLMSEGDAARTYLGKIIK